MIRSRRGKWQVRVYAGTRNGRRDYLVETHPTRAAAEEREHELKRQVRRSRDATGARMTVAELCDEWLDHARPNLSPTTFAGYQDKVRLYIVPELGDVRIGQLTTGALDKLYARLPKPTKDRPNGLDAQTVRHVHAVLRRALNVAVRWGYLSRNPADTAEPPKVPRRTFQPPTPEQLAAFIDSAGPELAMYVRLAAVTGCRRGELCALRWSDLDGNALTVARALINTRGQVVEKSTKSDRIHTIAIDAGTLEQLEQHREREQAKAAEYGERWSARAPIFTVDPGAPWSPDLASHRFRRAARRAGLPARLHDLRHWASTYGLNSGFSPRQVADRLNHADGGALVLARYGHAIPAADQALADSLGALLDAGSSSVS